MNYTRNYKTEKSCKKCEASFVPSTNGPQLYCNDRLNNHPDNLELWVKQQPSGQRLEEKFDAALKIIQKYPELLANHGYQLVTRKDNVISISDAVRGIAGFAA